MKAVKEKHCGQYSPVRSASYWGDPHSIAKVAELGDLAFLTKPLASADLIAAVNGALDSRAQAS